MISVVVPFYNEEENVPELHKRLMEVLSGVKESFEIIFVDDGSQDKTFENIKKLSPVVGLRLNQNSGQTKALLTGLSRATGETIITIDGDLENDPKDIPLLLNKFKEGHDVVSGWRVDRWQGEFVTRKIPSLFANKIISYITGVRLHDNGSNFRIYKKSVFDGLRLHGDAHRMLLAYLASKGARFVEVPVTHNKRRFGKSKYGMTRTFKVILDVLALHFFNKYSSKPMHFFGFFGFGSFFVSGLVFLWSLYYRVFLEVHFNRTPLPILVALFALVGVIFILMGLLAEIFVRMSDNRDSLSDNSVLEEIEN
jgi:glycosyltransferase involved in cell wall biosynthesis